MPPHFSQVPALSMAARQRMNEVNLSHAENIAFSDSQRAIFNVLRATLHYPAKPQVKASKIADDIDFFCESAEGEAALDETLWNVWSVVIVIASCIPPDHPWQASLVRSLVALQQRPDALFEDTKALTWKDLPNLSFCMREQWDDPTYKGEDVGEDFTRWKNLNSFAARLTSTGFAPWLTLPIWQLREALEEASIKGPAMECRLWVATEWLIHCAGIIFEDMNSKEELAEESVRALRTGSTCDVDRPLSVERWDFWKKRFHAISADADSLGLDEGITRRIEEALGIMDASEKD